MSTNEHDKTVEDLSFLHLNAAPADTEGSEKAIDEFATGAGSTIPNLNAQKGEGPSGSDSDTPSEGGDATAPVELEDRYKDKSLEEVIEMARRSHKEVSRTYNRLNTMEQEMRSSKEVINKLLDRHLGTDDGEEAITADKLLEDPEKAFETLFNKYTAGSKKQQAAAPEPMTQAEFVKEHPNVSQVLNSEQFVSWVQTDANLLQRYQNAVAHDDFDVAHDILTTFSEVNADMEAARQKAEQERENGAKALSGTPNGNAHQTGDKTIYSMDAVAALMNEDREKYNRLVAPGGVLDIAFNEGRVQ